MKTFQSVREVILKDIISITKCPVEIFRNEIIKNGPSIETTITLIEKNTKNNEYHVFDMTKDFSLTENGTINKNHCFLFWGVVIGDSHKEYIERMLYIFNHKKMIVSDLFDSAMGIKTADNKRFVSIEQIDNTYQPFFKGSSKYNQSYTSQHEGYLSLDDLDKNKLKNTAIPQEKFLSLGNEKIGVPEIGHKGIVQAFIYKNGYPSNSVWIYQVKENVSEKWLYVLLGLLNSEIYGIISSLYSSGFRIEKHDIDKLPIFFSEGDDIFEGIYAVVKDILKGRIDKNLGMKEISRLINIYL